MTDLSTTNLKRLLAEATPGPWTFFEEEEWEHVAGPEYPPMLVCVGHGVKDSDGGYLFGNSNDTVLEEHPGNLRLAAHSSALAEEVLRKREALHDLSEVWEAVSIDPDRTPAEQQLAATVVDHIDQILGDHDG